MKAIKKLIKMPSIEQFRNVVASINRQYCFVGLDENGDAMYDNTLLKPVIKFKGTVKLHGTNASVCYNPVGDIWAQSKENIITPTQDNAGFAFFVESNKDSFRDLMSEIMIENDLDMEKNSISIYGEWCGGNIQKGVGITNLSKSFFIFGVKITPITVDEDDEKLNPAYWVDYSYLRNTDKNIFNIDDYQTYSIDVDFNMPQLAQNTLSELTIAVEDECPVAKAFGFPNTIGEGIVWTTTVNGITYRFKVKGELHAGKSKVKTLNKVDDVKIRLIMEVADKVTPTWRLSQMLEQACDFMNGGTLDRSKLGDFIRLVINDVIKEEMDILTEAGLEPKDVNKYISEIARRYFFDQELV